MRLVEDAFEAFSLVGKRAETLMATTSRDTRIDLIRAAAVTIVLLHHFNLAYRLDDTVLAGVFGPGFVQALMRNGNYGVTMFFVVSGYLITSTSLRRWGALGTIDARSFYGLRVARIMPCLLLLLAVVNGLAFGGVPIFRNQPQSGVSLWLVDLAALGFWMNVLVARAGWVNYALCILWSLAVEEVFYLTFPLMARMLRRPLWLLLFWLAVAIAGPVYRLRHQGDEGGFLFAYLACFDAIAIGCAAAVLASRIVLAPGYLMVLQVAAVTVIVAVYFAGPIADTNVLGVSAVALGTAILLLPRGPVKAGPSLLTRGFAKVGSLSYELYLFHLVLLSGIRTVYPAKSTVGDIKLVLFAAFLASSLGSALLVSQGFTEPLNRAIRRRVIR